MSEKMYVVLDYTDFRNTELWKGLLEQLGLEYEEDEAGIPLMEDLNLWVELDAQ